MDDAVVAFTLMRAEGQIGASGPVEPSRVLAEAQDDWSPSMLAERRLVLSKVLMAQGLNDKAAIEVGRAARVYEATGTFSGLVPELRDGTPSPAPPTLDSAVALLELAGHPHILGREAFAILDGAGCCTHLALLAVGPSAVRAVAVSGWSETDAVEALAAAAADDVTVVGPHRDESWQLLVRPRPELDDHCTVAAVRKLVTTARTLDRYRRDEKERSALWPAEALDGDPESIWASEQSAELLANARRIASNPVAVLITGETGTGKEMLARAIHRASDRAERPLQAFNCSAVPRDMIESQLFGYRRGAFTGADTAFPGVIRAAAGGTLFLDEIGDLSLDLQPKLLRFLDCQEIHPLGEPHPIKVDVRVIAATNANLDRMVAEGRFREDLLHRLNVVPFRIPSLRERREEIPPLVEHYLRRFSVEQKKGNLSITDEVLEYLVLYNWTGNLRQLANEVRRMVAFADRDSAITPALLSPEILASRRTIAASSNEPEIRLRLDQPLPDAIDQLEQTMVRRALERANGRVEEASRLLGISRKGLFLKRRRWGLHDAS
jgi:DNA-binding NtrC family response regulator